MKCTYLDQEEQVGVLALGSGTVALFDVVLFNVDTLGRRDQSQSNKSRINELWYDPSPSLSRPIAHLYHLFQHTRS